MKLLFYLLFTISFLFLFSCKEESSIEVSKSSKIATKKKEKTEKPIAKTKRINSANSNSEKIKVKSTKTKSNPPKKIKERVFESPVKSDVVKKTEESKKPSKNTIKASAPKRKKVLPVKNESVAKGVLQFNSASYDFGFIEMGEKVDHTFYFKNTGSKAVNISNATATCGCTTPVFPFLPIEPGDKGKIDVRFNSKGRLGPQSAIITVFSDAQDAQIELNITGTVRTEIIKSTEEVIDTSKN